MAMGLKHQILLLKWCKMMLKIENAKLCDQRALNILHEFLLPGPWLQLLLSLLIHLIDTDYSHISLSGLRVHAGLQGNNFMFTRKTRFGRLIASRTCFSFEQR